jgi:hypothetical protein
MVSFNNLLDIVRNRSDLNQWIRGKNFDVEILLEAAGAT